MAHHELALPDRTGAEQVPAAWQQPRLARFLAQCPRSGRPPPRQDPHRSPAPPLRGRPLTRQPGPATASGSPPVGGRPQGKKRPVKGMIAPGTCAGPVATMRSRALSGRLFLPGASPVGVGSAVGRWGLGKKTQEGIRPASRGLGAHRGDRPSARPRCAHPFYGLFFPWGRTPTGEDPLLMALFPSPTCRRQCSPRPVERSGLDLPAATGPGSWHVSRRPPVPPARARARPPR